MDERLIPKVSTPKISGVSDKPNSRSFQEAHAEGQLGDAMEEEIAVTRIFILEKYSIPPGHVLVFSPSKSKRPQREIRVFSILSNTENPSQSFYAEGHTAHAVLNKAIVAEFGKKIGVLSFNDLIDQENMELKKPWVIKKGFLDPFHNGFKEFPNIREDLIGQIEEAKDLNGLSDEEVHSIENGNHGLPNWFLSV